MISKTLVTALVGIALAISVPAASAMPAAVWHTPAGVESPAMLETGGVT